MYFALHHGHLTQAGLIPSLWVSVQFQQRAADVGKEIGVLLEEKRATSFLQAVRSMFFPGLWIKGTPTLCQVKNMEECSLYMLFLMLYILKMVLKLFNSEQLILLFLICNGSLSFKEHGRYSPYMYRNSAYKLGL